MKEERDCVPKHKIKRKCYPTRNEFKQAGITLIPVSPLPSEKVFLSFNNNFFKSSTNFRFESFSFNVRKDILRIDSFRIVVKLSLINVDHQRISLRAKNTANKLLVFAVNHRNLGHFNFDWLTLIIKLLRLEQSKKFLSLSRHLSSDLNLIFTLL